MLILSFRFAGSAYKKVSSFSVYLNNLFFRFHITRKADTAAAV